MAEVIDWLLDGDPAIGWQVQRDLLDDPYEQTLAQVETQGWGARLLSHRESDGTWPTGWYSPKWTSTFYSMQVLQLLGVPAPESVRALRDFALHDGGIFTPWSARHDDLCVTGMMLGMSRFAGVEMPGAIDRLLSTQSPDGGWNCRRADSHSSLHTTLSVLEGLAGFEGGSDVAAAARRGREFLLAHHLYRSHRTGEVISAGFTRFSFPYYWFYDVLRALDYWRGHPWDDRLTGAVDLVRAKGRDGRWNLQNKHAGRTWFDMEQPGRPSRWNTLRAMRVLRWVDGCCP